MKVIEDRRDGVISITRGVDDGVATSRHIMDLTSVLNDEETKEAMALAEEWTNLSQRTLSFANSIVYEKKIS